MSEDVKVTAVGTFNETPAPEVKAPEAAAPPPEAPIKVDPFAPKFAALTRRDKEIREREKALQTAQKQIETEKAELAKWRDERAKDTSDYKTKLKANPLAFLQEHEIPFDELVQMQLNDGRVTPEKLVQQMKAELDSKYSKELEELKKNLKEKEESAETAKLEQIRETFKTQITDFVENNKDTYELVHFEQAQQLVFDVIETHYQETGRILKIEEAAKATEEHLEEELKKRTALKKFQTSKPPEAKPDSKAAPTLSNTMSSEVPTSGTKRMSNEESLKQAAKLIRWDA